MATSTIANSSAGGTWNSSTTRDSSASTQPPKKPASAPSVMPGCSTRRPRLRARPISTVARPRSAGRPARRGPGGRCPATPLASVKGRVKGPVAMSIAATVPGGASTIAPVRDEHGQAGDRRLLARNTRQPSRQGDSASTDAAAGGRGCGGARRVAGSLLMDGRSMMRSGASSAAASDRDPAVAQVSQQVGHDHHHRREGEHAQQRRGSRGPGMASSASAPRPGQENTVSTSTAYSRIRLPNGQRGDQRHQRIAQRVLVGDLVGDRPFAPGRCGCSRTPHLEHAGAPGGCTAPGDQAQRGGRQRTRWWATSSAPPPGRCRPSAARRAHPAMGMMGHAEENDERDPRPEHRRRTADEREDGDRAAAHAVGPLAGPRPAACPSPWRRTGPRHQQHLVGPSRSRIARRPGVERVARAQITLQALAQVGR